MSTPKSDYLTPAEYLEIERKAETKSEYIDGRMYAMSPGASRNHNKIVVNFARELSFQMRGSECETYVADMRVKVSPDGMYTYPDVVAVCGKARFEDAHIDTLLNPMVIVEVLSPSTEAYDRGEKFRHYQRIESLQEYVLVSQSEMRIEHFVRSGRDWMQTEITDPNARLRLASIACDVPLSDVYDNVELH